MSEHPESEVLHKGPCEHPGCGSSDACAVYDDGHSYCFSCGKPACSSEAPGEPREKGTKTKLDRNLISGSLEPIKARRLDLKTVQKFGYRMGRYNGKPVQIAPYHNKEGIEVAQKLRFRDKDEGLPWIGNKKAALPLFGQTKWRDAKGGKMVVVTEGELDAMSVAQAMGLTWPAVSIPDGAQSAKKAVMKAADWLERFDKVVLMFDMDEEGQKAATEAAAVLTPGKAYIASLPLKDASDMLQAGRSKELVDAAWGARAYRPDGIRTVAEVRDAAMKPVEWGLPFPWASLTEATYGIRRRELHALGAGVGSGKTTAFKQMIAATIDPTLIDDHSHLPDLIAPQPRKAGVLLLEENPAHSLKTIAGIMAGKRFHVPGVEYDEADLSAAFDRMDGWLHLYDHFGSKDWDSIAERIRYMVLGLGIKDIFLDHMTAIVAHEEDERRALDAIMAEAAGLAEQLDFTLFFISHLTTAKGTPHEEGGRVHESQFTGSRAIARWSHFMHGMERNKQEPDEPTTWRVLKDRYTGDGSGVTFGLGYDRETGRLHEVPLADPDDKHGFGDETQNEDF